jgi:hypothetical protein
LPGLPDRRASFRALSLFLAAGAVAGQALAQAAEQTVDPPRTEPTVQDPGAKTPPIKTPPKPLPPISDPNRRPPGVNQTKIPTSDDSKPDPKASSGKKPTLGKFLNDEVIKRIQISGSRRLGYHSHRVEGDEEAFNLASTYGLGSKRWTDIGSVTLQGRQVLGLFNFDAVIQDNRFQDPQAQRFSLDYDRGGLKVSLGDIQGRLMDSNRFVTFNRSLKGAMAGYKTGAFEVRALVTEAKGEARTVTIQGSNSSGPYFLQSNQILRGSERVEVDGESLSFGRDYTIDYDLGAITFVNRTTGQGRIIPPTSVITATYESFGLSGSRGQVLGLGGAVDFGRFGRLGVSGATQRSGGEGRLSTRLEQFQGFGAPGTPYFLQFEPLAGEPIVVRVDGIPQTENLDYTLDPDNPSIFYFTRFMPSTSTIDVIYTPRPTQTVNGDRSVLGLDYRVPLGWGTTLSVAQASSRLSNTPTPKSGTARSVDLRHERGRATAAFSWRSIPNTYTGIETTGFNRNETSTSASLQYRLRQGLTSGLRHQNSAISQTVFDANGNERTLPTRLTTSTASLALSPSSSGIPWSLSHQRSSGINSNGPNQTDSTTLSFSRKLGRLDTRWELNSLLGASPNSLDRTKKNTFNRQGFDLRGSYLASEELAATFSAGISRVSAQGETGAGRDLQLGLTYRPDDNTQMGLNYSDSDSGGVNSISGFSSGFGFGFNGNGFSSGATGTAIVGVASIRRLALTGRFRPAPNLSLGSAASFSRSKGTVSSNTETSALTLSGDWEPTRWLQISGIGGLSTSRSLSTGSSSRAFNYSLSADGAPQGRVTFSLGASGLLSTGGVYSQNVYQTDARFSYLLRRRHRLALDLYSTLSTGYQPQSEFSLGVSYRYEIWQGLGLSLTHRWHRVSNREFSGGPGAYSSRGFDLELGFNFSR